MAQFKQQRLKFYDLTNYLSAMISSQSSGVYLGFQKEGQIFAGH